jgi:hypothetical protein
LRPGFNEDGTEQQGVCEMKVFFFNLKRVLVLLVLLTVIASTACMPALTPVAAVTVIVTSLPTETTSPTITPTLTPSAIVTPTLTAGPTITLTLASIPIKQSGQLEISVPGGISGFLEWKCGESGGLTVTIRPVDGDGRNTGISSGSCTTQSLINVLEYFKTQLQPSAPAGAREWLDQAIEEVQQLE